MSDALYLFTYTWLSVGGFLCLCSWITSIAWYAENRTFDWPLFLKIQSVLILWPLSAIVLWSGRVQR